MFYIVTFSVNGLVSWLILEFPIIIFLYDTFKQYTIFLQDSTSLFDFSIPLTNQNHSIENETGHHRNGYNE